jgi:hypothetical protein
MVCFNVRGIVDVYTHENCERQKCRKLHYSREKSGTIGGTFPRAVVSNLFEIDSAVLVTSIEAIPQ